MTLKQCYEAMGSDYEDVLDRLCSERLVQKFAIRFLSDPSYEQLMQALEAQNGEEAFRGAHTLKGVSQNLGFTRLYETSEALTEALRKCILPVDESLIQAVTDAYRMTVDVLNEFAASQN